MRSYHFTLQTGILFLLLYYLFTIARGRVVLLDTRSRGIGFDSRSAGHVIKLWASFEPLLSTQQWWCTRWNEKWDWTASDAHNTLYSPQGDETMKGRVPLPGGNWCNDRWPSGDIWARNIHLYRYISWLFQSGYHGFLGHVTRKCYEIWSVHI